MKRIIVTCLALATVSTRAIAQATNDTSIGRKEPLVDNAQVKALKKTLAKYQTSSKESKQPGFNITTVRFRKEYKLMQFNVDAEQRPYDMLLSELRKFIDPNGVQKGLQLVTVPVAADWNDAKTGTWARYRKWGDAEHFGTIPICRMDIVRHREDCRIVMSYS